MCEDNQYLPDYVKYHFTRILLCLVLSILVGLTTSATAWLLDPAVKKIFIDKDATLAWLIPLAIIFTFSAKGLSLYFARLNILIVGQRIAGELQKKIASKYGYKLVDHKLELYGVKVNKKNE